MNGLQMLAWELACSTGVGAGPAAALWEAGVTNLEPSRFVLDGGERALLCHCPALSPDLLGVQRLLALTQLGLDELVDRVGADALRGVGAVLLGLPARLAARPGSFELGPDGRALLQGLAASAPLAALGAPIEAFPFGRAGGALALQRAAHLVRDGHRVLWAGVDSQHDWPVLSALARDDLLLTEDNIDGVRPGEAAAFVLLGETQSASLPVVAGLGLGREPPPATSDKPVRAEGLTRAIRSATRTLRERGRRCSYWLLDTTHEASATARLQRLMTSCADVIGTQTRLLAPLQNLGDVGAASLPLFAALAAEAWRHGVADDHTAVLAAGSADGACGALLLAQSPSSLMP